MIQLTQVSKSYGANKALDGLDLSVEEGEIFALLGPNGAGKTTTINLLLGFLTPDSGSVQVHGMDPASTDKAVKKLIGYIPENVNLYPHLSGLENLEYFAQLASLSYSKSELEGFLNQSGLQKEAIHNPIKSYSKGMRQKVGIAIALAKKSRVLLLDEPASGLDPVASRELSQLIRKLAKEGCTILMASHDLFRVKETADKIGILYQGKLHHTLPAEKVTANELEELYLDTVNQLL